MKRFLVLFLVAVFASCDNAAEIKADIDSTADRVKNSETVDSIEAKSERAFDSVKSKGGRLIDKAEDKLDDLRKDSIN